MHLGTFLLSQENTEVIGGCLPRCCAPETGPETDVVDLTPCVNASKPQQPLPPYSSHASHPPICDLSTTTSSSGSGDGNNNPEQHSKDNIVFEGRLPAQDERTAIVSSREDDKRSSNILPEPLQVVPETPRTTAAQQHVSTTANSLQLPLHETPFEKNTVTVVALNDLQKWHGSSVIVRANVTAIQDRLRLKKLVYAPLPVLIEDKTASAKARINSETCMDLLGGMHATEFKAVRIICYGFLL